MSKNNYEMDMCSGSIWRKMLIFAFPLMCSGVLQLLFNAADIIVVSRFAGDNSLGAVGSTSSLINLLINLFVGLSIGTNVLVAQFYGSGNSKALKDTIHTSIFLSIFSGIFLTIIGIASARQLLTLMQSPPDVLELAVIYLRFYFVGMTSTMVYNFGSAILRAVGDTKRPLYYLVTAGIINFILNLVFVICFDMGVAGVAIATAISQTVSAFLVIRCLVKYDGDIKLNLKELSINKIILKKILTVGLPAGVQGVIFSLSNVVIQSSVNSFGETIVAANSAAMNIEGFIYIAMNAFYQATISFVSQNYGACQYKRITKIVLIGEMYAIITGLVLGNLSIVFGKQLVGIYSSSAEVIELGIIRLNVIGRCYFFAGMMDVLVGALRGIGYSFMPMIVSLIGVCGLRLMWIATVFKMPKYHSIDTIYVSYPLSWLVAALVLLICFIWAKKRIEKI